MKNALIVFVKNPVLGKVKTRLAHTIGDEKALAVYLKLLQHTHTIGTGVVADKFLFYSDTIGNDLEWKDYEPRLQLGYDLGEKMHNAFAHVLEETAYDEEPYYTKAVIIGSDCLEITTGIIQEAFTQLDTYNMVIGPAADGGYYLLGMKKLYPEIFQKISWSTSTVLQQTLNNINDLQLPFFLLPVLNDIDEENDLAGTQLIDG